MHIEGRCHCGNLSFSFRSQREPRPRACSCSFCRAHGAKSVVDPEGGATIQVARESELARYRFGARLADYLVCRACGVYIGAVIEIEGALYATLNIRATPLHAQPAESVSYDAETPQERVARRRRAWTPAELVIRAS